MKKDIHSVNLHCDENTSFESDLNYFIDKKLSEATLLNEAAFLLKEGEPIIGTEYEAHIKAFLPESTYKKLIQ